MELHLSCTNPVFCQSVSVQVLPGDIRLEAFPQPKLTKFFDPLRCYKPIMIFTNLQWVNSLCPSDAIWWHRSGSTLPQVMASCLMASLQWRHNGHVSVSNHQPHDCLLSRLFRPRSKENIKAPRHWPLCGEFTGTGEFPTQIASYTENVSIWWHHHVTSLPETMLTSHLWGSQIFTWEQLHSKCPIYYPV